MIRRFIRRLISRKSRVSFSDAVVTEEVSPLESRSFLMFEPKPTDFYHYLEQIEGESVKTYNDEEFRLRGVKQYHLKQKAIVNESGNNSFCPLPEKTVFLGKVRFYNLREDQLGFLLWSMTLEKDSLMNLGKAKSYGYGAVKLNILSIRKFHLGQAYDLSTKLNLCPYEDLDIEQMIEKYKSTINTRLVSGNIEKYPSVIALFTMKDQTKILNNNKTSYMNLKEFGNQKNTCAALPHLAKLYKTK